MASFNTLLTTNVEKAFSLIGDLAEDVILSTIDTVAYDFATSTTSTNAAATTTVSGVISKIYNSDAPNTQLYADIILKSTDISIDGLDNYDVVTFRSKSWNIVRADDNGFVITLVVSKKGN